mmetsp:Transcript_14661/g.17785  ORF Transcript_14661/g.17785 Transcript_14661/m.17785 type:complete len:272 (+) Transcript_14661:1-816(+)
MKFSREFVYTLLLIQKCVWSLTLSSVSGGVRSRSGSQKIIMSVAESQSERVFSPRTIETIPFPAIPQTSQSSLRKDTNSPSKPTLQRAVALPHLSIDEEIRLGKSGSVERQRRRGRIGDAFIVVDSALPFETVWETLLQISNWSMLMRGVKSSKIHATSRIKNALTGAPTELRAGFSITKLRIPANLVLKTSDISHTITFELDKSRTNLALDALQGFWHIEPSPNGNGLTRVWLAASVQACAVVPNVAIDYVASKALRRATKWLRPHEETR